MELWIRSQEKDMLLKANCFYYDYQQENHHITCLTNNELYWVGVYATKERALEVLDEIHKLLQPKGIIKFNSLLDLETTKKVKEDFENKYLIFGNNVEYFKAPKTIVYDMPLE